MAAVMILASATVATSIADEPSSHHRRYDRVNRVNHMQAHHPPPNSTSQATNISKPPLLNNTHPTIPQLIYYEYSL